MTKKRRFIRSCVRIAIVAGPALFFALPVFAQQGAFVSLTNGQSYSAAPMLSSFFGSNGPTDLAGFFNALFTTALSAGAILAVLRLAYAGWLYMGSADMWGNKSQAKEVIRDSIIGLLLLVGIYIILYQINPCILNLNILQDFGSGGGTSCTTS